MDEIDLVWIYPYFVLRLGNFVLRIIFAALAGIILSFQPQISNAACGSSAIGTHRTIVLDANKHRSFNGGEKSLGLRHKEVILTFDDGPIAGKTNRVLDILKKNCAKATFFAVGKMARAYPSLTRRIVRDGHTLAHHTFDHNRLPKYSKANASSHVDKGIKLVQKAGHNYHSNKVLTPFFRFPYLASNKSTRKLLRDKKLIAFGANIDSLDWKRNSSRTIVNRVMGRLKREGKGIILMHDIHSRTANMLPTLLAKLKSNGYKIVHMVAGKRTGRLASAQIEENNIEIAKVARDKTSRKWVIRKTEEISSGFIFKFEEFDPIIVGSVEPAFVDTAPELKVAKIANVESFEAPKTIKQWALRSAIGSF